MNSTFAVPAGKSRQAEILPSLVAHVIRLKDNPAYPLHKERTVRYMLDRWSFPAAFEYLDELCGMGGLQNEMFPDIPPVRLYGTEFGNEDILHTDIEWLGTDGAQLIIDYRREAHIRMVAEREVLIESERARKAAMYASLSDVIKAYREFRRPAWIPVTGEGPGSDKASRYFGRPWLPDDTSWPMNDEGSQLSFILQINIGELPVGARRHFGSSEAGLVSLFYDIDAEWNPEYEGSEDNEVDAKVLYLDTACDGCLRDGRLVMEEGRQIATWRAVEDYPAIYDVVESAFLPIGVQRLLIETGFRIGGEHHRHHGEVTTADDVRTFIRTCEDIWGADACDAETAAEALDLFCGSGNKLGGWPSWDAGRRWPTSGGERLDQFFQMDMMSADWRGFSFWRGDERGRIFFNPTNPRELSVSWEALTDPTHWES